MATKTEFVGYHKISGERVSKVHNPLGLMSVYVVEAGNTPYSGMQVQQSEIVKTVGDVTGPVKAVPETVKTTETVPAEGKEVEMRLSEGLDGLDPIVGRD